MSTIRPEVTGRRSGASADESPARRMLIGAEAIAEFLYGKSDDDTSATRRLATSIATSPA
jgi:hypothetical protein